MSPQNSHNRKVSLSDLNALSLLILFGIFHLYILIYVVDGLVTTFWYRAAGSPNVKIGVVGGGTASIFEKIEQQSKQYLDVAFCTIKRFALRISKPLDNMLRHMLFY